MRKSPPDYSVYEWTGGFFIIVWHIYFCYNKINKNTKRKEEKYAGIIL